MPLSNGTSAEVRMPTSKDVQSHHPRTLNVIIVGGGIAGLSAAIALRKQGHHVKVFEQSKFANEIGAAIHMTPNATGALEYLGIDPKDAGAVYLETSKFLSAQNETLRITPNSNAHRWQNEWLQAHRAHLHNQLKEKATTEDGYGEPVKLITSSRVVSADAQTATITLADGSSHTADVIVGADGVNSRTRSGLGEPAIVPFKDGHNAFRFTLPRETALADPVTKSLVNDSGAMCLWYSEDRKVVLYPTSYNKTLNFVCIHPAHLSEVSDDYQKAASKEKMLEVFSGFDASIVKLLGKVEPADLKIYPLYDMDSLSTYVSGRLALIGDAAHPFTPHLGQGGAQAIEDAVSLGVMLDKNVTSDEVPERLELYNKARYSRSSAIQNYSRIVGGDGTNTATSHGQQLKVHEYLEYGFSHKEQHASSQILREHKWRKAGPDVGWRQPTVFGPLPGPHQDLSGRPFSEELRRMSTTTKTVIKFKTSATILRNLFPNSKYCFDVPDTVAYASWSVESRRNLAWLAGGGYESLALYIHGVSYMDSQGQVKRGMTYLPVQFENLADAITPGREELGLPLVFSDIDVSKTETSTEVAVSWRGAQWATMELKNLKRFQPACSQDEASESKVTGILVHKRIPSTGVSGGKSDADYDVLISADHEKACLVRSTYTADPADAIFSVSNLGSQKLPTLSTVVERLAEIPIFEIVRASATEYQGAPGFSKAERLH